jgi:PBSX family phage terminase large subunit
MELSDLQFSVKQLEYIRNANKRWNAKIGATQCGKTYVDVSYMIYERLRAIRGKAGLRVIMGVSKGTIERNVLEPMRDFWGHELVGEIKTDNTLQLFGEKVYCLGAEKVSQVSKLRGMKIAYAYLDEAVDFNEEVFALLKSRLSLQYSVCDFTGNPASPTHFIKQFIDNKDLDIYSQPWTLFDNPFLSTQYIDALTKEYQGTIYYDRYILGKWKRAEGVIYRKFADNPHHYILRQLPARIAFMEAGIDFGGNNSATTFVLTGFTPSMQSIVVLEEFYVKQELNPNELNDYFIEWAKMVYNKYGKAFDANFDSAEPVLARGLSNASMLAGVRALLRPAIKSNVNNRIRMLNTLLGAKRFYVMEHCTHTIRALQEAVWDTKATEDKRLDNGTSDIDTLDALEYSIERYFKELADASMYKGEN